MALQKELFVEKYNITKPDCYWKISIYNGIFGGKDELECHLQCYLNKTKADSNRGELSTFSFKFTPNLESTKNFIEQAYDYVKTLTEFQDAVNV